jgi:hypothetical protein
MRGVEPLLHIKRIHPSNHWIVRTVWWGWEPTNDKTGTPKGMCRVIARTGVMSKGVEHRECCSAADREHGVCTVQVHVQFGSAAIADTAFGKISGRPFQDTTGVMTKWVTLAAEGGAPECRVKVRRMQGHNGAAVQPLKAGMSRKLNQQGGGHVTTVRKKRSRNDEIA